MGMEKGRVVIIISTADATAETTVGRVDLTRALAAIRLPAVATA